MVPTSGQIVLGSSRGALHTFKVFGVGKRRNGITFRHYQQWGGKLRQVPVAAVGLHADLIGRMGKEICKSGLRSARHILCHPDRVAKQLVVHNPVRLTAIRIPFYRDRAAGDGGGTHIVDRTASRGHGEFYIIHITSVVGGYWRLHHQRNEIATTRVGVEIDRERLIRIVNKTHRHEGGRIEQVAHHTHNQVERIRGTVLLGKELELQGGYRIGGHIQARQNGILVAVCGRT